MGTLITDLPTGQPVLYPSTMSDKKSPSDFLASVIHKRVEIKLNDGSVYKGNLQCLDGYMNCALEQTEEWIGGVHKNTYGDCFVRGNNVLYINLASTEA